MKYQFKNIVKVVRTRLCPSPKSQTAAPQPTAEATHQKLAALIRVLSVLEKAAEIPPIPYLKGAVGTALEVAKCVQKYQSNNEEMNRLALECGALVVEITNQVKNIGGVSANMEQLVESLVATLDAIQRTVQDMSQSDGRTRRFLAQEDYSERLKRSADSVRDAQIKFMTLALIASPQRDDDAFFDHDRLELGSFHSSGTGWIAFHGKLQGQGGTESVIVKRYQGDQDQKKTMIEADIAAFKQLWHANLLQYMGRSRLAAHEPHAVLRGVTSDHVSSYIALKFAEDNQRGSVEALRLLRDFTNALAFTVGKTASSSFDISKVHLNDSGNLVVVNLDPVLDPSQASDDGMPYWRSWQEICIELLAGDPGYEPNPSIEYNADPTSRQRLEYLRPILGQIHYGGVRFREASIVQAFNSQGLVLAQAHRDLQTNVQVQRHGRPPGTPIDTQVLRAMWRRVRELHYVFHLRDPVDIDVGDIGYIAGTPPYFVRLANVRDRISDGWVHGARRVKPLRFVPKDQWTTSIVQGVVRHEFRFSTLSAIGLVDWRNERPRLFKDFLLRKINSPLDPGLVVECSEAWKVLGECAATLAAEHHERPVSASSLILIVYFKQQSGYAMFRLNRKVDKAQWKDIWAKDGLTTPPDSIYFYESPPGGPTGVWGYFSLSPVPGSPYLKWTPDRDDAGEAWGWTYQSMDWTVEISKPNIKQYIRYVQL
ncbi:hypothetical protein R3P38DRAFT_117999 [Favolaschia claudopus]|uniref:Fungal N-terminal domain-containing protein n=1 Tax=Favolaschia claudopus TaxID=2862362 RepID=A0AAV9ZVV1_9AGAR